MMGTDNFPYASFAIFSEDWSKAFVSALRIADLLTREMATPTDGLAALYADGTKPPFGRLRRSR
jgi:hypothetical protein